MKDIEAKMDAFVARKGSLKNGPAAVLSAYQAYDEIGMLEYKVYRYPQLQRDVDTRNQDVAAGSSASAPCLPSLVRPQPGLRRSY